MAIHSPRPAHLVLSPPNALVALSTRLSPRSGALWIGSGGGGVAAPEAGVEVVLGSAGETTPDGGDLVSGVITSSLSSAVRKDSKLERLPESPPPSTCSELFFCARADANPLVRRCEAMRASTVDFHR